MYLWFLNLETSRTPVPKNWQFWRIKCNYRVCSVSKASERIPAHLFPKTLSWKNFIPLTISAPQSSLPRIEGYKEWQLPQGTRNLTTAFHRAVQLLLNLGLVGFTFFPFGGWGKTIFLRYIILIIFFPLLFSPLIHSPQQSPHFLPCPWVLLPFCSILPPSNLTPPPALLAAILLSISESVSVLLVQFVH